MTQAVLTHASLYKNTIKNSPKYLTLVQKLEEIEKQQKQEREQLEQDIKSLEQDVASEEKERTKKNLKDLLTRKKSDFDKKTPSSLDKQLTEMIGESLDMGTNLVLSYSEHSQIIKELISEFQTQDSTKALALKQAHLLYLEGQDSKTAKSCDTLVSMLTELQTLYSKDKSSKETKKKIDSLAKAIDRIAYHADQDLQDLIEKSQFIQRKKTTLPSDFHSQENSRELVGLLSPLATAIKDKKQKIDFDTVIASLRDQDFKVKLSPLFKNPFLNYTNSMEKISRDSRFSEDEQKKVLEYVDKLRKLESEYNKAPIMAETGMVNTQAHSKLMVTPHLTALKRFVAPTPMIEPVIV